MRKYSILLVDDEPLITKAIGDDLKEKGYEVIIPHVNYPAAKQRGINPCPPLGD